MIKKLIIVLIVSLSILGIILLYPSVSSAIMKIRSSLTKVITKQPNNTGLVGYWNFDSSASTTPGLADLSGNANQGTGYSGATPTDLSTASSTTFTGKIGNGGLFDGSDDNIDVGARSVLQINGDVSFGAWINIQTAVNNAAIISTGLFGNETQAANANYLLSLNTTSGIDFNYVHESGAGVNTTNIFNTNLAINTWYHVFVVRNATAKTVKLYVNGVQADSTFTYATNPDGGTSSKLNISREINGSYYFDGLIDEVRIYNRALSADEIKTEYENTRRYFVNMPQTDRWKDGLVGYWPFDGKDISGTTAYDRGMSSTTSNGTLTGEPTAAAGIIGQALEFDNINDYVDIGDVVALNFDWDHTFSISAWISHPYFNETDYIFSKGFSDFVYAFVILTGSKLSLALTGTSGSTDQLRVDTPAIITDSNWNHVVATYDGSGNASGAKIYVNGVSQSLTIFRDNLGASTIQTTDSAIISTASSVTTFSGKIDEVRVYNRVLSAGEILEQYLAAKRE